MAVHLWTVICRKTAIDSKSNLSLIELYDSIDFAQDPEAALTSIPENQKNNIVIPVEMVLVSQWMRTNEDKGETAKALFELRPPNGSPKIILGDITIDLQKVSIHRVFLNIPAFPYRGLGKYHFEVKQEKTTGSWETVSTLPLQLRLLAIPSTSMTQHTTQ